MKQGALSQGLLTFTTEKKRKKAKTNGWITGKWNGNDVRKIVFFHLSVSVSVSVSSIATLTPPSSIGGFQTRPPPWRHSSPASSHGRGQMSQGSTYHQNQSRPIIILHHIESKCQSA
jgi:hypothetical protein